MDPQQPPHPAETVDETLHASAERVRTSRELLDEIDERLARGAELLDQDVTVTERGEAPPS